ncbi:MAG TPA: hypothetical protein VFO39_06410 [Candidatus Sulfotelmatobacter sp.]|nr:hypothetical protein [Candidatus Sulfotelmatobacter sp.]
MSVLRGRPLLQASLILILLLLGVMTVAEAGSRLAFPRISKIEGRIRADERRVQTIRSVQGRPTVLLVGNSLLLMGLDYPHFREAMGNDAYVVRYTIENTEYLDWYYGLHHLFATGIRPSVVVLCLNLTYTISPRTLGDYSARHLFGVSELFSVAHDAGMDATRTSELLLSHWSAFYADRTTMRNFMLNRTAPSYAAAMHHLADSAQWTLPDENEVNQIARARLRAIDELCRQYGSELVLLIPPSTGPGNEMLASAAKSENVNFDFPYPAGSLARDLFRPDGAHLNEKGAAIFTQAIIHSLKTRVSTLNRAKNLEHGNAESASR